MLLGRGLSGCSRAIDLATAFLGVGNLLFTIQGLLDPHSLITMDSQLCLVFLSLRFLFRKQNFLLLLRYVGDKMPGAKDSQNVCSYFILFF